MTVYCLPHHPTGQATCFGLTGPWTATAPPQACLLGALFMPAQGWIVIFTPSVACAGDEVRRERKDFVRLWWHWTIALIAIQSLAFFLERVPGA
jgi:hypothetical protein